MHYVGHVQLPETSPVALPTRLVRAEPVERRHTIMVESESARRKLQEDLDSSITNINNNNNNNTTCTTRPTNINHNNSNAGSTTTTRQIRPHAAIKSLKVLLLSSNRDNRQPVLYFLTILVDQVQEIREQRQQEQQLVGRQSHRNKNNVAQLLLVAMRKYPSLVAIQERCLYILSTALDPKDLPAHQSVKQVLRSMRNHPRKESVQLYGCKLLEYLISFAGFELFTTFGAEGGVEQVYAAAGLLPKIADVCKSILFFVRAIAEHHKNRSGGSSTSQEPQQQLLQEETLSLDHLHGRLILHRLSVLGLV